MKDTRTDEQLLKQVRRGDKHAFDLLVLRYQHKIMAVIARYVNNPDDVLDVAQEAFIRAYRAIPKFRGDSRFYTWLYRIAINTAKNHLVARGRRPPRHDIDADEAMAYDGGEALHNIESPENLLQGEQLAGAVFEAIDRLPEELKTAVTLREFDGLSYEQIAEVMQCPVGTVRSRIFRAREAIEQRVRPWRENR